MDRSDLSEQVIALGKRLVAEIGLDDHERDAMSRWLAHDIAQKMEAADRLTGSEGETARHACTTAILRLWEHRAILPVKVRPFASAEKAVEVLEALNPANVNNRFFDVAAGPPGKDSWLATAIAVDKAARVMLRACARLAASDPDGRMSEFVKLAESAGLNVDPENAYRGIL